MSILCNDCIFNCDQCKTDCKSFKPKINKEELRELNLQIIYQNVNLHKLCRDNNMSFKYLKKMLNGKIDMSWKSWSKVNSRLNESAEWIYEEERFDKAAKEMTE